MLSRGSKLLLLALVISTVDALIRWSHPHVLSDHQRKTVAMRNDLRKLYTDVPRLNEGYLDVGDGHTLYFETYGNPDGLPALFLHGGPGAGCFPRHAAFFDPAVYRIVLFDQRGCGASKPRGELMANDTPHLVADIEAIRNHLGVGKWRCILGGSWGVTLALSYAIAHQDAVECLVLRGVCLMRAQEIDHLFGDAGQASRLNPPAWKRFVKQGGCEEFELQSGGRRVLHAYYRELTSLDENPRLLAARAFAEWEGSMFSFSNAVRAKESWVGRLRTLCWNGSSWRFRDRNNAAMHQQIPTHADIDAFLASLRQNTAFEEDDDVSLNSSTPERTLSKNTSSSNITHPNLNTSSYIPAQAILTAHYSINNGFLGEMELLGPQGVRKLTDVKCIAIQGALDFITPACTALELLDAWPCMHMRLVLRAGHSMYDPEITDEIIRATDAFRDGPEKLEWLK